MTALFIKDPARIITPRSGPLSGPDAMGLSVTSGMSIYVKDGVIQEIAPARDLEARAQTDAAVIVDALNRAVVPGFVDAHSHLVFGGNRADEFAMRTAGATYEEIAAQGGGIARTVKATREASKDELKALARERLDRAMRQGTTTMEVKSGYGLDAATELKMLRVVAELNEEHPVDLIPTFLGAHAVPKGVDKAAYIEDVKAMLADASTLARFCDVFCEHGYFTPAESMDIMEHASTLGMLPRLHANQFHSIGCIEAAIELGAVSVDHLEVVTDKEIALLAGTDIGCVMLPGVSLFLDIPFAPGRRVIDSGCLPVLASDFNPGSNMSLSLQLVMSLACMRMGLSVDEALTCITRNAAHTLRLDKVGCIAPGWQADLLLLDSDDHRDVAYFYGENHIHTVIKKGQLV
ncbi:imidazolonepropionase [Pseudodesulfovibrio sediminis]|uniref:Imidazolonepropionase n=1 Tax=Pseudodesulfovibrio sediminis TaxID=2810563 RepID=A0ABM9SEB8_9BACT|nr:imidazolonepropionase [Pseudodesulfovibrio sediminis]BCS89814.1 imidazolonepropionase [Pseudodesulfovibrio sediminis]